MPTPDANKAIVHRYFHEVWNRRNFPIIDELFAGGFVPHDPAEPQLGTGPEAVRRLVTTYITAFPDMEFTIEETIAEGDRVVVRWMARGTHQGNLKGIAPTGKWATVTGIVTFRISDGKIVEGYENWDTLGLMHQLGVLPLALGAVERASS
jgi:steroid delta-isomerase-like uncharacterized protein